MPFFKVYSILAAVMFSAPVAAKWTAPLNPRKPALPSNAANPVDALLSGLKEEPVPDNLYARRVYLDVWGLLPTPDQLAAFERDNDPDKRARLVDRLLEHKEIYASHWISFWNDLLRNDEGVIYHGERKSISTWLLKALEENMPYDRFVAALLNPPKKDGPEGFILGVTWRGEIPAAERPPLQAAQNSAQTFLGINLKCNSCHDSFISNWKLKDAYGLASFFSDEPLELVRCESKTGQMSKPKFLFPELGAVAVKEEGSLEERRAEAARLFTMRENGRLPRTLVNRYWKQLFGRGIVEPVDDMSAEPWNADLLDYLASDFADHGYDLKYLLRVLLTSRAYQLPSVNQARKPYVFEGPLKRRLSAEQFVDAISTITGEWRYRPTSSAAPTSYVRDWQLKSTTLTKALGRPVRDQVTTERLTQPTTLQALELVNGQTLAVWLHEGARRLVEPSPDPPQNLFDSGVIRRNKAEAKIDIRKSKKLILLVEDVDSYYPSRVVPMWKDAVLVRGRKKIPLASLLQGVNPEKLKLPARLMIDIEGKKFKRFEATALCDKSTNDSEVNAAVRFFVFDQEPDPRHLVRVKPQTPVEAPHERFTADALVTRLYSHALQREPGAAERTVAAEVLGAEPTVEGVEDFLWMILQSPEFQYIR